MRGVSVVFGGQAQDLYDSSKEYQGCCLATDVAQPRLITGFSVSRRREKRSPYLCTPVTVRRLGIAIRWPNSDLATVVDAEIDLSVKDRVADGVQVSGGEAEAGEIISWAVLHDLEHDLLMI